MVKIKPIRFPRYSIHLFHSIIFLSGATALIYQIAWIKMLALTFGSTTTAAAIVIAGFIGGLGTGAWAYRWIHKYFPRPMLIYALLELGITFSTILLSRTFYHLPGLLANNIEGYGMVAALLQFSIIFFLLLPATAMMGATFPALCNTLIYKSASLDLRLGTIYGLNTLGAAFGTLLAGLVLVESVGLLGCITATNAINFSIGLVALYGALNEPNRSLDDCITLPELNQDIPRWIIATTIFIASFVSLSSEVLWIRILSYSIGNSTYALTVVISAFLIGLGSGSFLLSWAIKRDNPIDNLALCHFAIGTATLLGLICQWLLWTQPEFYNLFNIHSIEVRHQPWQKRLIFDSAIALVTLVPSTCLMGLSFSLATRLLIKKIGQIGHDTGSAYLLASAGSVFGGLITSVLFLPLLGTVNGIKLMIFISLAISLGLVLSRTTIQKKNRLKIIFINICMSILSFFFPAFILIQGERTETPEKVIFQTESDISTVQVLAAINDPKKRSMAIDGIKVGWSESYIDEPWYRKQLVLAHLPMSLDRTLKTVLNIGLGTGTTLAAIGTYPWVKWMDCIEINRGVVEASRFFNQSSVLTDPRTRLIIDDGLHYLLHTQIHYDLIISDGKQDPFFSGNAALLSESFYQAAKARLQPQGLFVQWVSLSTLNKDMRIILRTLCHVFPHLSLFYFPRGDVVLVGSLQPLSNRPVLDQATYEKLPVQQAMERYYIDQLTIFLAHWTTNKEQLLQVLGEGPLNTWDYRILEFTAFKASWQTMQESEQKNITLFLNAERLPLTNGLIFDLVQPNERQTTALIRRAFAALFSQQFSKARSLAELALQTRPQDGTAQGIVGWMQQVEKNKKKITF